MKQYRLWKLGNTSCTSALVRTEMIGFNHHHCDNNHKDNTIEKETRNKTIKKQTTNVNKHRKTMTITPATTTILLVVLITSWNVRLMMSVVVQLTELVKLPGAGETKPVAREEERSSLVLMDMDTLAVLLRVLRSILHSNRIEPSHARLAVLGARAERERVADANPGSTLNILASRCGRHHGQCWTIPISREFYNVTNIYTNKL